MVETKDFTVEFTWALAPTLSLEETAETSPFRLQRIYRGKINRRTRVLDLIS